MPASGSPKLNPGKPYPDPAPNPTFGVVFPLPAAIASIAAAAAADAMRGLGLPDGETCPLAVAGAGGALCAKHHCRRSAA